MTSAQIPREIFRAYDIRGRALGADAPLTPDLAFRVALAYAGQLETAERIVVGGDNRFDHSRFCSRQRLPGCWMPGWTSLTSAGRRRRWSTGPLRRSPESDRPPDWL